MGEMIFLHGLDSSGRGFKGRYFASLVPEMLRPDFSGSLENRMEELEKICENQGELIMVGSSFGGLMATCYAILRPNRVRKLILLAPALNFAGFTPPDMSVDIPTTLIIGRYDTVTPPGEVLDLARRTFSRLEISISDDDHMLHDTFTRLDWFELLSG